MPADPDVDGPAGFIEFFEEEAVLSSPDDELVFSREKEGFVSASPGRVEKRFGSFEEKRDGVRVVSDLPMGKPPQGRR